MRRKKVDETASRVVQEEVQCFAQLRLLWDQLGRYPSKAHMKELIAFLIEDTHIENRKLGFICL